MNRRPTARWFRFGCLWSCLLLGSLLDLGNAMAQEASRIAYVDMQRLIDNAPQVTAARARLRAEFAERDHALDADNERLQALDERIRREADMMTQADADSLRQQAEALRSSIQRSRERLSQQLNSRIDQELDKAWPMIEAIVADYARDAGYDLVLGSPVIYASGRVDITDRVLDRMKQAPVPKP